MDLQPVWDWFRFLHETRHPKGFPGLGHQSGQLRIGRLHRRDAVAGHLVPPDLQEREHDAARAGLQLDHSRQERLVLAAMDD